MSNFVTQSVLLSTDNVASCHVLTHCTSVGFTRRYFLLRAVQTMLTSTLMPPTLLTDTLMHPILASFLTA